MFRYTKIVKNLQRQLMFLSLLNEAVLYLYSYRSVCWMYGNGWLVVVDLILVATQGVCCHV